MGPKNRKGLQKILEFSISSRTVLDVQVDVISCRLPAPETSTGSFGWKRFQVPRVTNSYACLPPPTVPGSTVYGLRCLRVTYCSTDTDRIQYSSSSTILVTIHGNTLQYQVSSSTTSSLSSVRNPLKTSKNQTIRDPSVLLPQFHYELNFSINSNIKNCGQCHRPYSSLINPRGRSKENTDQSFENPPHPALVAHSKPVSGLICHDI
jgi:hypothetical protein